MHIKEILASKKPALSFEFFPPKTPEGAGQLFNTISDLIPLKPAYVSVTYGAGGTTRTLTRELVIRIQKETDLTVVAHLTCVGATRQEIHALLTDYQAAGIQNIMALRGDLPLDPKDATASEFQHAADLIRFIKQHFPAMGIGVAGFPEGHPETKNRLAEMMHLKEKADAGADYICTQLFFDNRDFYDFRERCELAGISIPIIAGIMPITAMSGMLRMAELSPRTRFPARLQKALMRGLGDDEAVARIGTHWATEQVLDLIDQGVSGIHFYTLNRSKATREIYAELGIKNSDAVLS